ncbi:MAG: hypothetical protein ABI867_24995 [Kofleriaceae bacterium]
MSPVFTDFDDDFFREGDELSASHEAEPIYVPPFPWRRALMLVPCAVAALALTFT